MIVALLFCALFVMPLEVAAKSLRYANQGDLRSLDPQTLNETTTIAHLSHVYEGLTRRGKTMGIEPALAERWEVSPDGLKWRFFLRRNVQFHDGSPFTADDVVFSADRARAPSSNFQTHIPRDAIVRKVNDHTVDFVLPVPNPILHADWHSWFIMSRRWAEANAAVAPAPVSATMAGGATLKSNGTGPFRIESHEPGIKTVFKANPQWWDKPEHNLTEIVFRPIASPATRVAALLSGEIDIVEPLPLQDIEHVGRHPATKVVAGSEVRTVFLGFDQSRDELLHSSIKGRNPFKDTRVREAFYRAVDIEAIRSRLMRGLSRPAPLLISPEVFVHAADFKRLDHDVPTARRLLAEAGYPDGFEIGMDCPNDRYVNDGQICVAVAGMLAKAGIKVNVNAQPKAQFFAKILKSGGYGTSFFLLGWSAIDSLAVLRELYGCRDTPGSTRGFNNVGGYCNHNVDALTDKIMVELDVNHRNLLIKQAFDITTREVAYIPLHQQPIAWGVSKKVNIFQRPDNAVLLYWATMD